MPELPEVESVVRTVRPIVVGRRIERIELRRRDIIAPAGFDLAKHARGRVIASVERRGKRIVFRLADGNQWFIHLGMSGRLSAAMRGDETNPHTHFVLRLRRAACLADELRFVDPRRFGGIYWLGESSGDFDLGPEPLALRPVQLRERLASTRRNVKAALLDQRLVAGLGNIYVDEALHAAGISPTTIASKLSAVQVGRLTRSIKAVLRRAISHRGSTLRDYRDANGKTGNFQRLHRAYGREGKPCLRCKGPIEKIMLGGRGTHFCPKCQPNDPRSLRLQ